MTPIIKTTHLEHVYELGMPFEKHALYDVDLEIEQGDFAALIGHTGSGKSTLIQHFNALMKPTNGKIFIDGIDITADKVDLKQIRRMVGLVFQYPEHQLFEETVEKDIAFGPRNMGIPEEEIRLRVQDAMQLVGLPDEIRFKSPFELSGGQKRRAAIAGVLAMKPKVLILDEPTAGLDPAGRDDILNAIVELHKKSKDMTVLFVSHSMEDVAKIARHVIVMNKGRVALSGTVAEVFSHGKELAEMGLAVPQVTMLFDQLRAMGADVPKGIYTVNQAVSFLTQRIGGEHRV